MTHHWCELIATLFGVSAPPVRAGDNGTSPDDRPQWDKSLYYQYELRRVEPEAEEDQSDLGYRSSSVN